MGKLFSCDLNIFVIVFAKKKNEKKIGKFLGTNISRNVETISFNFNM